MFIIHYLLYCSLYQEFAINILHIHGFDDATNHLEWFANYPLQVINRATKVGGYTLSEGKKLFSGCIVLDDFGNSRKGINSNLRARARF